MWCKNNFNNFIDLYLICKTEAFVKKFRSFENVPNIIKHPKMFPVSIIFEWMNVAVVAR